MSLTTKARKQRLEMAVEGMHCASCVSTIEGALVSTEGVEDASANLATEKAQVSYRPDRTSLDDLLAAVERVGYRARGTGPTEDAGDAEAEHERRAIEELRTLRRRFIFAAVAGALLLGLAFVWSPL